jgi:CBS domain-containing protein
MTMTGNDILSGLPDLHQITRNAVPGEISSHLRNVRSILDQDRLHLASWSDENALLLANVDTADISNLTRIHAELNRVEIDRFLLTRSVEALHRNCTLYRDVIATRTMALVTAEMTAAGNHSPDIPHALLSMGSDGRKEQTLITDQDYLIVYDDGGGEAADVYFQKFSTLLVDYLEVAGFKKCTGDIMPTNPCWRGSYSQWRKHLLSIVRYECEDYAKSMMDLIVLSDARYVAGDKSLADELAGLIRGLEQDYSRALWGMAKAATEMKVALNFMKRFLTERRGDHKGEFNLKLLAWAPLVMNIRILSINQGIPATNTVERIQLLEKEGSFSVSFSRELQDAYQILTKYRILLQIKVIRGTGTDSYHINPGLLPPEDREKMRHALMRVEELQKIIHANFAIM